MSQDQPSPDVDALLGQMQKFKALPKPPGAVVCSHRWQLHIEQQFKEHQSEAMGKHLMGMDVFSCLSLLEDEVFFFDSRNDALDFIDAIDQCRKHGFDPRPAIEELKAKLMKRGTAL